MRLSFQTTAWPERRILACGVGHLPLEVFTTHEIVAVPGCHVQSLCLRDSSDSAKCVPGSAPYREFPAPAFT